MTTIKGIVIPVDWDEKGKVVIAAISTHTEDECLIIKITRAENCWIFSLYF